MNTRRKFIKQTVGSMAALAVASEAFPHILIPRQKSKLGVALVGLGYYSKDLLAPALKETKNCYLACIEGGSTI